MDRTLFMEHPDECPETIGYLPYLIHPPSRFASDASWRDFRDRTLLPAMKGRPNDPNLPRFLRQVEIILAWRATIEPERRFWKAD
jgi:hypothetical protein